MKIEEKVQKIRQAALAEKIAPVDARLQGIAKARIRSVLKSLDLEHGDMVDAVFALLDPRPTWFGGSAAKSLKFCDAATTAHVGCHVGILQRGSGKLDREGRDHWIKPLRDIGAVEVVILTSTGILQGHPIAKSPNSVYRLNSDFVSVLKSDESQWEATLNDWISEDNKRIRLQFQAEQAELTRKQTDSAHAELIRACCHAYAPKFLPGFEVVYVDATDGERISDNEKKTLRQAGLLIRLDDAMPDVLLWNPKTNAIWVIEAVTSDGEVDEHKLVQLTGFSERNKKSSIGFTTAYPTWKLAAARQGKHKNLAVGGYIWIREDASKQYRTETFYS